jgi:hypothetical protein
MFYPIACFKYDVCIYRLSLYADLEHLQNRNDLNHIIGRV